MLNVFLKPCSHLLDWNIQLDTELLLWLIEHLFSRKYIAIYREFIQFQHTLEK